MPQKIHVIGIGDDGLEAVTGPDGEITDVRISYPMDLTKQMLEYSGHTVLSVNRSPALPPSREALRRDTP